MPRIRPFDESTAPAASRELAAAHAATGGRMTNMKWTLAHAPVALDALLQWYPLYDAVEPFLGERRTWIFCHAISTQSDCLICSTFFRRLLIDQCQRPGHALGRSNGLHSKAEKRVFKIERDDRVVFNDEDIVGA